MSFSEVPPSFDGESRPQASCPEFHMALFVFVWPGQGPEWPLKLRVLLFVPCLALLPFRVFHFLFGSCPFLFGLILLVKLSTWSPVHSYFVLHIASSPDLQSSWGFFASVVFSLAYWPKVLLFCMSSSSFLFSFVFLVSSAFSFSHVPNYFRA